MTNIARRSLSAGLLLLAAVISVPAWADDARKYNDCLTRARQQPDQGFEFASEWRDHGGGPPAEHCVAIALIALKEYSEAAKRLEHLAGEMVTETPQMRAGVMAQAAEAWSEAGLPKNAIGALTEALRLDPGNTDDLVNRAAAHAALKEYGGAIVDLNSVVSAGVSRGDIYAYRAAAYRLTGDVKDAQTDAELAVRLAPELPEAWLERANVRRLAGNESGARQDWLKVVELAPNSEAANAARDNLEKLDVNPDKPAK